jgi:hypothetical protein
MRLMMSLQVGMCDITRFCVWEGVTGWSLRAGGCVCEMLHAVLFQEKRPYQPRGWPAL